jgi:hypothetical protein
MFLMRKGTACAKKVGEGKLYNLKGCKEHQLYDPKRYEGIRYEGLGRKPYVIIDEKKFRRLAAKDMKPHMIGQAMDMTPTNVVAYATRKGIYVNKRFKAAVDVNEVRVLAEQRLTQKEIADKLDCHFTTISKISRKHNIDIKRKQKVRRKA